MRRNRLLILGIVIGFSVIGFVSAGPSAAELKSRERNILVREAEAVDLAKVLIADLSWIKVPDYKARAFWDQLPAHLRQAYIKDAETYLDYSWPAVKATDYLEFIRSGDRRQEVFGACDGALIALVMGELVEGRGRFLDQIINGAWVFCEQTWWGWSAHLYYQKAGSGLPDVDDPTVDLGVSEVASNLSWTCHLFKEEFDRVHPLIARRIKQEVFRKALDPYFQRDDFIYMGFRGGRPSNWNTWVNANLLAGYLLLEEDPAKKAAEVQKVIRSLDKFLNGYSDDGGCDEGPSYWSTAGGRLSESLEMLKKATGGRFDVFNDPLIRNIGQYFYKLNIHAPYFVNFADADAKTGNFGYTVYRYGKGIGDPLMWKFGAHLVQSGGFEHPRGRRISEQLNILSWADEIWGAEAQEALVADFWLPDTEVAGARDKDGSVSGFFFAAKGGFNAESHNHNDVGSCVMYFDGRPCLIDLGREEYVAKTFGPQRYEIWTMQSGYHNLPVINGLDQKDGAIYKAKGSAFSASARSAVFSTDLAGAYPEQAQVKRWLRRYTLNRGRSFEINDRYELRAVTGETSSNLMTYCRVAPLKPGVLRFEGEDFSLDMTYDRRRVSPKIEFIPVTDRGLRHYWPKGVTRIRLVFLNPGRSGELTVTFTRAGS